MYQTINQLASSQFDEKGEPLKCGYQRICSSHTCLPYAFEELILDIALTDWTHVRLHLKYALH